MPILSPIRFHLILSSSRKISVYSQSTLVYKANILQSVLFGQIRMHYPERLAKIVLIEGDITEDDFGISESDLVRVLSKV